jgi:DNA modification methylase
MIADDVAFMKAIQVPWKTPLVLRGDGRTPSRLGLEPETFDVIVTSPPYPNNIDYTEVYKLELWLLGLVHDASEFLTLRRGTFRSHPTTAREAPTPEFLSEVRQGKLRSLFLPLVERTKEMPHPWRSRLLLGYFDDLYKALKEYMLLLRPGGMAFFVVGNSLHGGADDPYLIPTDLILAELARTCGFGIERVVVARGSKRRLSGNHFLRETVVVLRKPGVRGD